MEEGWAKASRYKPGDGQEALHARVQGFTLDSALSGRLLPLADRARVRFALDLG